MASIITTNPEFHVHFSREESIREQDLFPRPTFTSTDHTKNGIASERMVMIDSLKGIN